MSERLVKRLLWAALIVPFVMPTLVVGTAFLQVLGPSGPLPVDLRGTVWAILMCVQGLPFLAALLMSMINVLPIFKWRRAHAPMPDLPSTVLRAGTPATGELTTGR